MFDDDINRTPSVPVRVDSDRRFRKRRPSRASQIRPAPPPSPTAGSRNTETGPNDQFQRRSIVMSGLGRCCGYDPEFGPRSRISDNTRLIGRLVLFLVLVLVLAAIVTAVNIW